MGSELATVLGLEVPVIVLIGERKLRLKEILALVPGAIIELQKSAEDELELLINNKRIGTGSAVKVGENFGIRMSRIGELAERIDAMGPGETGDEGTGGGEGEGGEAAA